MIVHKIESELLQSFLAAMHVVNFLNEENVSCIISKYPFGVFKLTKLPTNFL
jgi:hypothetical protein